LSAQDGSYLVRYSQSRMKDGFFALDVAKLREGRLTVESYLLQYDSVEEKFLFDGVHYDLFQDFVQDRRYYPNILSHPILYSQSFNGKDPKYQDDTQLIVSMSGLAVQDALYGPPPATPISAPSLLQSGEHMNMM